jgi:hypothetical protein
MSGSKKPVDFLDRCVTLTQDRDNRLVNADDFEAAIDAAVKKYSTHRPQDLVAEIVGNGTNDLPLPTLFVDGFSMIETAEYPMDQIPATMVDDNEFYVFRKAAGPVLRLETYKPTASQSVRVAHTGYHTSGIDGVPGTVSSIPDTDFEAVCALAASYACTQLSTLYAAGVDPGISADMVDGTGRAEEFRKRSSELESRYMSALGLTSMTATQGTGQAFVDLDTTLSGSGASMLTHPRRWT